MVKLIVGLAAAVGYALRFFLVLFRFLSFLLGPALIVWGIYQIDAESGHIAAGLIITLMWFLLDPPRKETK